jgi:DNA-binding GntR family transcriptional regulator
MDNQTRETSQQVAYNKILEKIISEKLAPGMPLRQEHIGKELGLSAIPVREAFKRLENEGWLENIPYRGVFLKKYDYEEIKDLYLLREAIEGVAIRQAIDNAKKEDYDKVAEALNVEKEYISELESKSGDTNMLSPSFESDFGFHRSILSASHSKLLVQKSEVIQAQFHCMALSHKIKSSLKSLKDVYSEHSLIYQAMTKGWADIAEEMLRKHIAKARKKHLGNL